MNHETKKEETNHEINQRMMIRNLLEKVPVDQLLGSVTTYAEGNDKNQSLRSSARVIKKIKLDANLNATSSTSNFSEKLDKKDEQKPEQGVQKEPTKKLKTVWSVEDRTLFFEALNEYGKDFDNIHSYIVQKLKKKGVPDNLLVTRENVRHLYYKTWHKISKYLKFSEGTKKSVQELYALINYGELRKKVGMFTQKINHKLNELIYNGCLTLRVKGKTVRIKTPMCTALRRLNRLDGEDDIKLPARVVVELRPKSMSDFLKVQNMALNPRIRTVLPLQKKLGTFITCVAKKWKAAELEYLKNLFPLNEIENGEIFQEKLDSDLRLITPQLKFSPPKGAKVNLPKTDISEYFARENICLKVFEEKMGIPSSVIDKKESKKSSTKLKTDNSTENLKSLLKSDMRDSNGNTSYSSENYKTIGSIDTTTDDAIDQILILTSEKEKDKNFENENAVNVQVSPKTIKESPDIPYGHDNSKVSEIVDNKNKNISKEEQLTKLNKIQNGWTAEDCDTLTIGELYLMFGSSSKLLLEYYWVEDNKNENQDLTTNLRENFKFNNSLRKLVSIINLQQKKVHCSCGHVCSQKNSVSKKHVKSISDNEEKNNTDDSSPNEIDLSNSLFNVDDNKQKNVQFDDFLKPQSKPPVQLMAQLDSIQKLKPKYSMRKGRRLRQLVVERELPLTPEANSAHQIVRMNIISQKTDNSTNVEEFSEVDSRVPEVRIDNLVENVFKTCEGECSSNNLLNSSLNTSMGILSNNGGFLQDSPRSLSPSGLLKENSNWITSEVGDFSLSSFLGHLDSPMKTNDDASHDMDAQVRSLLTENSFDYTAKFADLANKVTNDTT